MTVCLSDFSESHRCRECGKRAGQHKSGTCESAPEGKCPTGDFPKFPRSVEKKRGMDAAQVVWVKRLDRFWNKSATVFAPC